MGCVKLWTALDLTNLSPGVCALRIRRSFINAVSYSTKMQKLLLSKQGHARMKLRKPKGAKRVSRQRIAEWTVQVATVARMLLRLNSIQVPMAIEVEWSEEDKCVLFLFSSMKLAPCHAHDL